MLSVSAAALQGGIQKSPHAFCCLCSPRGRPRPCSHSASGSSLMVRVGRRRRRPPLQAPYSSAQIQLFSSFAPPSTPTTLIYFYQKMKYIRQKMAARAAGRGISDVPSEEPSAGTPSWATSWPEMCRPLCHAAALVSDMCASVYTSFPLESVRHTGGSRGVACGWVAVNPRSAPGLLRACFLSDSRALSLWRPDRVLDLGGKVQEWLLAACLSAPLRAERLH